MNKKKINWGYFGSLILSVVLALAVGAAIMAATGYDPLNAYHELFRGATGCDNLGQVFTGLFTKRQFGNTVEYAMVLCICGLACVLGSRVGIFNVGGEGQLLLGAIAACQVGVVMNGAPKLLVILCAALAAMAVARYLGVPAEDAVRAISAYKAPAMRQQVVEAGGLLIIDDSYNASPDSMRSAIDVLATRPVTGKRAAVLADMLELGDFSQQGHYEVGSYARERGVELLVAVGPLAKGIAAGYGSEAHWFATNEEATAFLQEALRPGDAVLVKGSRGMRTDEIVAALTAGQEA